MVWLPSCEKFLKTCLFVLTEFTNIWIPHDGIGCTRTCIALRSKNDLYIFIVNTAKSNECNTYCLRKMIWKTACEREEWLFADVTPEVRTVFPWWMSRRTSATLVMTSSFSPTTWTCCFPSSSTRSFCFAFSRSNTCKYTTTLLVSWRHRLTPYSQCYLSADGTDLLHVHNVTCQLTAQTYCTFTMLLVSWRHRLTARARRYLSADGTD